MLFQDLKAIPKDSRDCLKRERGTYKSLLFLLFPMRFFRRFNEDVLKSC
jgi:hypothetical protein